MLLLASWSSCFPWILPRGWQCTQPWPRPHAHLPGQDAKQPRAEYVWVPGPSQEGREGNAVPVHASAGQAAGQRGVHGQGVLGLGGGGDHTIYIFVYKLSHSSDYKSSKYLVIPEKLPVTAPGSECDEDGVSWTIWMVFVVKLLIEDSWQSKANHASSSSASSNSRSSWMSCSVHNRQESSTCSPMRMLITDRST